MHRNRSSPSKSKKTSTRAPTRVVSTKSSPTSFHTLSSLNTSATTTTSRNTSINKVNIQNNASPTTITSSASSSSPTTASRRSMAVYRGGKIIKFKKLKGVDVDTLVGRKPEYKKKWVAESRPADKTFPATAAHMPATYPGYTFFPRKNWAMVDPSPEQMSYSEKADGSGTRFGLVSYERNRHFWIRAYPRTLGEKTAAELRAKGWVPGSLDHVSGANNTSMYFYFDPVKLEKYKSMKASWSVEWHIECQGYSERIRAVLRDWQIDPVTRQTGHLRFVGTSPTHPTRVRIPLEFQNADENPAMRKGAVMLTPTTNISGTFDPSLASRLGTGSSPIEINVEAHDRDYHHTLRSEDVPLPYFINIPQHQKWARHVLMTFTKDLG